MWVHGTAEGFGVALGAPDRIDAARISPGGAVQIAAMPVEDSATLGDAIPSADGWLVAWTTSFDPQQNEEGQLYFVRYDAAGVPTGRTLGQPGQGLPILGADEVDAVDIAWCGDGAYEDQFCNTWVVSRLGAGASSFAPGAPFGDFWDNPLAWEGGRLEGPRLVYQDDGRGVLLDSRFRQWSSGGAVTADIDLPMDPPFDMLSVDARYAIAVTPSQVELANESVDVVVQSDVPFDRYGDLASAGGVLVGFVDTIPGPGGGELALHVFEVAITGARSPVLDVPIPGSSPTDFAELGASVSFAGSLDDGTTLVVAGVVGATVAVVLTCSARYPSS